MLSISIFPAAIIFTTTIVAVVLFPSRTMAPLEGWCPRLSSGWCWAGCAMLSREELAAPALQAPGCWGPGKMPWDGSLSSKSDGSASILLPRRKYTPVANGPDSHPFLCGPNLKKKTSVVKDLGENPLKQNYWGKNKNTPGFLESSRETRIWSDQISVCSCQPYLSSKKSNFSPFIVLTCYIIGCSLLIYRNIFCNENTLRNSEWHEFHIKV